MICRKQQLATYWSRETFVDQIFAVQLLIRPIEICLTLYISRILRMKRMVSGLTDREFDLSLILVARPLRVIVLSLIERASIAKISDDINGQEQ